MQIDSSDTSQDKILELFLIDTIKQISLYLEVDVFPEELPPPIKIILAILVTSNDSSINQTTTTKNF